METKNRLIHCWRKKTLLLYSLFFKKHFCLKLVLIMTRLCDDLQNVSGLIFFFFLNFIYLFIYPFMAVLGLRFCARVFSSCGKWGPLFITVRRPLTIVASLVAEHRLQMRRLSNCGSRT